MTVRALRSTACRIRLLAAETTGCGPSSGWADQAGRLDQDSASATGHIEDAHALADTGQGQQPPRHLVEEPNLVIAGGDPAKQADDALLGLLHVHPTLPPLDSTEQPRNSSQAHATSSVADGSSRCPAMGQLALPTGAHVA